MAARTIGNRLTLVLLAAGKSTRFGRPKQLEPVGPHGEALLDITLRDAFEAGCEAACIVAGPLLEALLRDRHAADKRISIAVQAQPSGTAHAALIGMAQAEGTCIVANADDCYGAVSMRLAAEHARTGAARASAIVAFRLCNTLSPSGPVNRAICTIADGQLRGTLEATGLRRLANGSIRDDEGHEYADDALVSMNLWVLRPDFAVQAGKPYQESGVQARSEFGLPDAARHAIRQGHAIRILHTTDQWCGLTFPGDADLVRQQLAARP